MKHFLVDITYTAPIEEIEKTVKEHREFLQTGYDKGMLLCSGPKNLKAGGIVIARAISEDSLKVFFADDPYKLKNLVHYDFVEFNPIKHQNFLIQWVEGKK